MSKTKPALEREGIPTPKNVAQATQEGNTPQHTDLQHRDAIGMADSIAHDINRLKALCVSIERTAEGAQNYVTCPDYELQMIQQLADLGAESVERIAHRALALCDIIKLDLTAIKDRGGDVKPTFKDGHEAAHTWWVRFLDARDAAAPHFFNSNLREFASILPPDHLRQFLDAVGALMVSWIVAGDPTRQAYFGAAYVEFNTLKPQEQDAQFDGEGTPLTDLARAMKREDRIGDKVAA